MARRYHFTREEIADELERCGYPLTSDEDVVRFERDLAALYSDGKFNCDDSTVSYSASDKFYDLPPPMREDIDFSKYYTKSQTSDCLLPQSSGGEGDSGRIRYQPRNLIREPPQLRPVSSKSAPNSARVEKTGSTSNASSNAASTKRKVMRKSDDGSSYIDELMFGRKLPPIISKPKAYHLPLVVDDELDRDFEGMPPLYFDFDNKNNNGDNGQIEDKISRLTLVSEGQGSTDSPIMRRSYDAHSNKARKTAKDSDDQSPLRLSDRDNRQVNGGKVTANKTTGSSSDSGGFLPSVITRPVQAVSTKSGGNKRVMAQDPVTRYAEYAKGWRNQRAPGEKAHKELRWQIRGQMLAREETLVMGSGGGGGGRRTLMSNAAVSAAPKAVSRPNTYVVPTEKKRQALRWAIRSALAAGRPPPSSTRYVNRAFISG